MRIINEPTAAAIVAQQSSGIVFLGFVSCKFRVACACTHLEKIPLGGSCTSEAYGLDKKGTGERNVLIYDTQLLHTLMFSV